MDVLKVEFHFYTLLSGDNIKRYFEDRISFAFHKYDDQIGITITIFKLHESSIAWRIQKMGRKLTP